MVVKDGDVPCYKVNNHLQIIQSIDTKKYSLKKVLSIRLSIGSRKRNILKYAIGLSDRKALQPKWLAHLLDGSGHNLFQTFQSTILVSSRNLRWFVQCFRFNMHFDWLTLEGTSFRRASFHWDEIMKEMMMEISYFMLDHENWAIQNFCTDHSKKLKLCDALWLTFLCRVFMLIRKRTNPASVDR